MIRRSSVRFMKRKRPAGRSGDRASKLAFAAPHAWVSQRIAADCRHRLAGTTPRRSHPVLTDNGTHVTDPSGDGWSPADSTRLPGCR
jgi:hypothetical protein